MADPDVPSFEDEQENETEATLMWNREDFELPDLDDPAAAQRLREGQARPATRAIPPPPGETGLDEHTLFDDVLDPGEVRASASLPVDGSLTQLSGPPPLPKRNDATDRELASEPPDRPSLAAPAHPRGALFYVGLGVLALTTVASAAYALYQVL